jgi:hypothetical protein
MSRWVAVLALALTACSQPTGKPVAQVTPSTVVTPSPTFSGKGLPTAAPSPTDLPLATVDFSCRLPVIRSSSSGTYKGGFITFPAATFAVDPRGGMTSNNQTGVLTTDASPPLSGALSLVGPPFYDSAQHRWVPVGAGQSTPDGSSYAYTTWDAANPTRAQVHIVNVAQATEKIFTVAVPENAMGFTVDDFDSTGVYLAANTFEHLPSGVWRMDPTSGALHEVSQLGPLSAVRSGFAWLAGIDPRDPSPPQLRRSGTASDSVVRVDLSTGAQTTWFYRPGLEVSLVGFAAGDRPIVYVEDPSGSTNLAEIWLSGGPGSNGTLIDSSSRLYIVSPQGDGDRIWFGGYTGIYLYTPTRGLLKVAAFSDLQPQESVVPAGFCR